MSGHAEDQEIVFLTGTYYSWIPTGDVCVIGGDCRKSVCGAVILIGPAEEGCNKTLYLGNCGNVKEVLGNLIDSNDGFGIKLMVSYARAVFLTGKVPLNSNELSALGYSVNAVGSFCNVALGASPFEGVRAGNSGCTGFCISCINVGVDNDGLVYNEVLGDVLAKIKHAAFSGCIECRIDIIKV